MGIEIIILGVMSVPSSSSFSIEKTKYSKFAIGHGYGKRDILYTVNGFITIIFITARVILISRILTRYTKFRTFRSE